MVKERNRRMVLRGALSPQSSMRDAQSPYLSPPVFAWLGFGFSLAFGHFPSDLRMAGLIPTRPSSFLLLAFLWADWFFCGFFTHSHYRLARASTQSLAGWFITIYIILFSCEFLYCISNLNTPPRTHAQDAMSRRGTPPSVRCNTEL
jgi:hypothetical protein